MSEPYMKRSLLSKKTVSYQTAKTRAESGGALSKRNYEQSKGRRWKLEDLLKGGGVFRAADFDLDGADGFCGAEGEADLRGCGSRTIHRSEERRVGKECRSGWAP